MDKSIEVKKSVKSSMRSMASLYLTFREEMEKNGKTCASVETLFNREHFEFLIDAVCQMAEKDDGIKYGMKNNLQYLHVSCASILRSTKLTQPGNENDAKEIGYFLDILDLNKFDVFGDHINKARQEKLRLPTRTPDEEDLLRLRKYTVECLFEFNVSLSQ